MLKYQVQNQTLTAKPKLESRSVVGVQRFLHLCCARSIMGCITQIVLKSLVEYEMKECLLLNELSFKIIT